MQGSSTNYGSLTYGVDYPTFGIDGVGALDTFPVNTPNVSIVTAKDMNLAYDAIINIEKYVGISGSADATSLTYKLLNTTGGHDHDGTDSKKLSGINSTHFTSLSGANLTSLDADELSSGTIPDGRFPSTLPALSGANLTALNASNLASGTVPDAVFPATLPALSGANLTNLNATNLASGTVPLARLSGITNSQIAAGLVLPTTTEETNWNTSFGWGNHASAGYAVDGSINNASIVAGAGIAASKLNLSGIASTVSFNDNVKVTFGTTADGEIYSNGNDFIVRALTSNRDVIFYGNKGGVDTELLRLDSSGGGVQTVTLAPNTTATYDIGGSSLKYKDLYLSGGIVMGSTTLSTTNQVINGTITPFTDGDKSTGSTSKRWYKNFVRAINLHQYGSTPGTIETGDLWQQKLSPGHYRLYFRTDDGVDNIVWEK